jgi:hypothetical protein
VRDSKPLNEHLLRQATPDGLNGISKVARVLDQKKTVKFSVDARQSFWTP